MSSIQQLNLSQYSLFISGKSSQTKEISKNNSSHFFSNPRVSGLLKILFTRQVITTNEQLIEPKPLPPLPEELVQFLINRLALANSFDMDGQQVETTMFSLITTIQPDLSKSFLVGDCIASSLFDEKWGYLQLIFKAYDIEDLYHHFLKDYSWMKKNETLTIKTLVDATDLSPVIECFQKHFNSSNISKRLQKKRPFIQLTWPELKLCWILETSSGPGIKPIVSLQNFAIPLSQLQILSKHNVYVINQTALKPVMMQDIFDILFGYLDIKEKVHFEHFGWKFLCFYYTAGFFCKNKSLECALGAEAFKSVNYFPTLEEQAKELFHEYTIWLTTQIPVESMEYWPQLFNACCFLRKFAPNFTPSLPSSSNAHPFIHLLHSIFCELGISTTMAFLDVFSLLALENGSFLEIESHQESQEGISSYQIQLNHEIFLRWESQIENSKNHLNALERISSQTSIRLEQLLAYFLDAPVKTKVFSSFASNWIQSPLLFLQLIKLLDLSKDLTHAQAQFALSAYPSVSAYLTNSSLKIYLKKTMELIFEKEMPLYEGPKLFSETWISILLKLRNQWTFCDNLIVEYSKQLNSLEIQTLITPHISIFCLLSPSLTKRLLLLVLKHCQSPMELVQKCLLQLNAKKLSNEQIELKNYLYSLITPTPLPLLNFNMIKIGLRDQTIEPKAREIILNLLSKLFLDTELDNQNQLKQIIHLIYIHKIQTLNSEEHLCKWLQSLTLIKVNANLFSEYFLFVLNEAKKFSSLQDLIRITVSNVCDCYIQENAPIRAVEFLNSLTLKTSDKKKLELTFQKLFQCLVKNAEKLGTQVSFDKVQSFLDAYKSYLKSNCSEEWFSLVHLYSNNPEKPGDFLKLYQIIEEINPLERSEESQKKLREAWKTIIYSSAYRGQTFFILNITAVQFNSMFGNHANESFELFYELLIVNGKKINGKIKNHLFFLYEMYIFFLENSKVIQYRKTLNPDENFKTLFKIGCIFVQPDCIAKVNEETFKDLNAFAIIDPNNLNCVKRQEQIELARIDYFLNEQEFVVAINSLYNFVQYPRSADCFKNSTYFINKFILLYYNNEITPDYLFFDRYVHCLEVISCQILKHAYKNVNYLVGIQTLLKITDVLKNTGKKDLYKKFVFNVSLYLNVGCNSAGLSRKESVWEFIDSVFNHFLSNHFQWSEIFSDIYTLFAIIEENKNIFSKEKDFHINYLNIILNTSKFVTNHYLESRKKISHADLFVYHNLPRIFLTTLLKCAKDTLFLEKYEQFEGNNFVGTILAAESEGEPEKCLVFFKNRWGAISTSLTSVIKLGLISKNNLFRIFLFRKNIFEKILIKIQLAGVDYRNKIVEFIKASVIDAMVELSQQCPSHSLTQEQRIHLIKEIKSFVIALLDNNFDWTPALNELLIGYWSLVKSQELLSFKIDNIADIFLVSHMTENVGNKKVISDFIRNCTIELLKQCEKNSPDFIRLKQLLQNLIDQIKHTGI